MHTHRLQLPKHQHFLDEKRHDPVTGDKFQEGDELVFCANCGSAFLKSSWEYMDGTHCEQHETLKNFPKASALDLNAQPELDDEILFCEYLGIDKVIKKDDSLRIKNTALWRVLGVAFMLYLSFIGVGYWVAPELAIFLAIIAFPLTWFFIALFKGSNSGNTSEFIEKNIFAVGTHYFHAFKKKWHYKSIADISVQIKKEKSWDQKLAHKWTVRLSLQEGESYTYESGSTTDQNPRDRANLLYGLLGASQHTIVYFKSQFPGDMALLEKLQNEYEGDLRELK